MFPFMPGLVFLYFTEIQIFFKSVPTKIEARKNIPPTVSTNRPEHFTLLDGEKTQKSLYCKFFALYQLSSGRVKTLLRLVPVVKRKKKKAGCLNLDLVKQYWETFKPLQKY